MLMRDPRAHASSPSSTVRRSNPEVPASQARALHRRLKLDEQQRAYQAPHQAVPTSPRRRPA